MALCCFVLLIQIVMFASFHAKEKAYVLASQKQSQIDLNVIDAAKEIIVYNQFVSRCHCPQEERIVSKHIRYRDLDIYFKDSITFLEGFYTRHGKTWTYTIYYDDHSIVSMKIESCFQEGSVYN